MEELRVKGKIVEVEWGVLERQFPTSVSTQIAEFVLEGVASIGSGKDARKETWREVLRLRAGRHSFALTAQTTLEMELIQDGGGKEKKDEASIKWRAALRASMKQSLKMLQSRIGERAVVAREAEARKVEISKERKARAAKAQAAGASSVEKG